MSKTSRQIRDLVKKDKELLKKIEQTGDKNKDLEEKIDDFIYNSPQSQDDREREAYENFMKAQGQRPGDTTTPPGPDTGGGGTEPEEPGTEPEEPGTEPPGPQPPSTNIPGYPTINLPVDLSKGKILWQSSGIWDQNGPRTMTKHHEFDKFDKRTEVAAGGHGIARKWEIPGDGNYCYLSGGMSRVYNWSEHNGTIVILIKWNFGKGLDNFSIEFFSRHNEPMPVANKVGGMTVSFAGKSVGSKFESFHKDYHDLGDDKYPSNKEIKEGDDVWCAIVATKDGNRYEDQAFIDWDKNGNYAPVCHFVHTETQNKAGTEKQPLYWRFRTNGPAPDKIKVWDVAFIQL